MAAPLSAVAALWMSRGSEPDGIGAHIDRDRREGFSDLDLSCAQLRGHHRQAAIDRIAQIHPNDPGIVIALMLELVELAPGEAIYLGAGRLHAYVDGLGVEIMAASDNVLRGGLTPKHVDVEELIEVLVPRIEPIEVLRGDLADDGERVYRTPAPEFELSRVDLDGRITRTAAGPEILVVTAGNCRIGDIEVGPTDSCFVPDGVTWTAEGSGQLFRARTP